MRIKLVLLFIIFPIRIFSQEVQPVIKPEQKTIHTIGFRIGFNDFHLRDEYLSTYIFSGRMLASGISYELQTERYTHVFDFGYAFGNLQSENQPRDVMEKSGNFSYSVYKIISNRQVSGRSLDLSLGTGISAFIANTDFIARDDRNSYDWSEQSWYCSNSLNLHFRGGYNMNTGKRLFLQLSIPVISLVSRPENGHNLSERNTEVMRRFYKAEFQGKPEFFWQNLPVLCQMGFKQPLGKKWTLAVDYRFEYIHSVRPLPLKMYGNQLQVGLNFRF